jgi:hypothetical protein
MADLQWLLELLLVGLLLATLFHALRLERALGVLKRDRAASTAPRGRPNRASTGCATAPTAPAARSRGRSRP